MSKYKPRKPREDIEYTFVFKNGKRYTMRFLGYDENDKLLFFNLTTKQKVNKPMTLRHFDWLMEKNLWCCKKACTDFKEPLKINQRDKRNLRLFTGLTEAEIELINANLAYTVSDLKERYLKAIKEKDVTAIDGYRAICESIADMILTSN